LILLFSFLILIRAGIIDEGIIAIQDFPIHYYVHQLMANKILPLYKSINGYILNYQLGYSPLYDHPPGGPLLSTLLYYLSFKKVPFWIIFRAVVALSFILPIAAIYFLTKQLRFHPFVSILSLIFWLSWFHQYFIDGTFISYYSLSFGIFSIGFFIKYLNFKDKKILFASSLFLSLSLLFQSMFYPFFLLSIFLLALFKNRIKEFFILLIISFLLGFVYFADILSWDYTFQIFSKQAKIFFHQYDINRVFWVHFYLLSCVPVLISLPIILVKNKKADKWKINFLLFVSFFLIFLSFILNFLQTGLEGGIVRIISSMFLIERIIFLDRVFFSVLASLVIFKILEDGKNFPMALILALTFSYFFTFFHYLFEAWYRSDSELFKFIYNWKLEEWYSLKLHSGVLKNQPKEDVLELFQFLKENTTKEARIVVEDSRWGKLGGNIMTLLAYYTDKYFVGGLHQGIFIEGDTWFVDSIIFGKKINEYKNGELENYFDLYNIKWVVVWTNESKNFFSKESNFKKVYTTSNGLFEVYEYLKAPNSYFLFKGNNANLEIINDSLMVLNVSNVRKGEKILLKFRYEKYWHAYEKNTELPLEKCGILMCLVLPKEGTYNIVLKYEEPLLLKIGKIVSLLSFAIILYFLIKTSFIQGSLAKTARGWRLKSKLYSI
jgi:hypothetical protein